MTAYAAITLQREIDRLEDEVDELLDEKSSISSRVGDLRARIGALYQALEVAKAGHDAIDTARGVRPDGPETAEGGLVGQGGY